MLEVGGESLRVTVLLPLGCVQLMTGSRATRAAIACLRPAYALCSAVCATVFQPQARSLSPPHTRMPLRRLHRSPHVYAGLLTLITKRLVLFDRQADVRL